MNGYVVVKFSNDIYAKQYTYMVPDNIKLEDIQNYVIVENNACNPARDISPYKIVKVVAKFKEASLTDCPVTKYIVDIIDGETYKQNRQFAIYRENSMKIIDNYFLNLTLEDKAAILLESLEVEEFDKILQSH